MITKSELSSILVKSGLVSQDAIEDPTYYDSGLTLSRIQRLLDLLNDLDDEKAKSCSKN